MKKLYQSGSYQLMRGIGVSLVTVIFVAGCASIRAPTEQIEQSKAAVTNAASAGGGEFAPVLLKSAIDKMDAAQRAMRDEDYQRARWMAEQAEIDAQLATATARTAKAQKAARALQEDNRVLRLELDRKTQ